MLVFVVIPVIGSISGGEDGNHSNEVASSNSNNVASSKNSAFNGDCGITASAEMGSSIIGYPELSISITNTTEKEISAIQFYAIPYNVYGEEITT